MRMRGLLQAAAVAGCLLTLSSASQALADGKGFSLSASPSSEGSSGKGGGYRSLLLSMPMIHSGHDFIGHGEVNVYGRVSLGLEASYERRADTISAKDQKSTGESMITQGRSLAVFVTRFSEPAQMAGFYVGGGAGYRQETANWRYRPDGSIGAAALDDQHFANHSAQIAGPTAHLRGGYRYVGKEYPLLIGAYGGLRHFQASVSDQHSSAAPAAGGSYTDMSASEKDHLKRRFTTAPEVAIEFGFVL